MECRKGQDQGGPEIPEASGKLGKEPNWASMRETEEKVGVPGLVEDPWRGGQQSTLVACWRVPVDREPKATVHDPKESDNQLD